MDICRTINKIKDEILEQKITNKKIIGILLTGSFAKGTYHNKSDIDIFIIVDEKMDVIEHKCINYMKFITHYRICSLEKYKYDCEKHERTRPAIYSCKILMDTDGICKKYLEKSKIFLKLGPKKLDEREEHYLLANIKNEISTISGLISSENFMAATLLINEVIRMIISYYNNLNGYWMENDNYLFSELKKNNIELGNIVENIILSNNVNIKFSLLKCICKIVIPNIEEISGEYFQIEKYEEK